MLKGSLQQKNGIYQAVFRIDGKQKWVSLRIPIKGNNKRKAEQALQEVLLEYSNNTYLANDMLFIDFLDMWIQQIKPLIKPSTWEGYDKVVNGKIKPYFTNKRYKLSDLRGMYFTEYFVYLKEHGKSNSKGGLNKKAVKNIRGVLSSALNYAVENDMIKDNPVSHSRLPMFDTAEKFTPTIYSAEDLKQLLAYATQTKSKATLFLYLLISTGTRKGELLALTWDNVDFDNNSIFICQNRTGSKKELLDVKTRNGIRTVLLTENVMNMLKAEKEHQEKNKKLLGDFYKQYPYDYVIRQEDGNIYNPNSINRIINKMTEQIGLPHCRIHDFRHPYVKLKLKFLLTQHYRCIGAKVLDFPLNFKPVVGVNIHLVYKHICECLCQGVFLFHCFCCLQSF